MKLYDASGRLVRTLVNSDTGEGWRSVAWNGLDDTGRPVGPGVYFAHLVTGTFKRTQTVLWLAH